MEVMYNPLDNYDLYVCFEHAIISTILTYGKEAELLLEDSLNISFSMSAKINNYNLLERIFILKSGMYKYAYKYFGIRFYIGEQKNEKIIDKELREGRLCIANVDLFWDKFKTDYYKNIHSAGHCRVLVGESEDNFILYSWGDRYLISKIEFFNACQELLLHYIDEPIITNINYSILEESIYKSKNKMIEQNWIDQLNTMFTNINIRNMYELLTQPLTIVVHPLFKNFQVLAQSRTRYKIYIEYMVNRFDAYMTVIEKNYMHQLSQLLSECSRVWWIFTKVLLKEERKFKANPENYYVTDDIMIKKILLYGKRAIQVEGKLYNLIINIS